MAEREGGGKRVVVLAGWVYGEAQIQVSQGQWTVNWILPVTLEDRRPRGLAEYLGLS